MKVKTVSLFLGYRELQASLKKKGAKYRLYVEDLGEIAPVEYIRQGFRITEASKEELQALVQGGYESPKRFAS